MKFQKKCQDENMIQSTSGEDTLLGQRPLNALYETLEY